MSTGIDHPVREEEAEEEDADSQPESTTSSSLTSSHEASSETESSLASRESRLSSPDIDAFLDSTISSVAHDPVTFKIVGDNID